MLPAERPLHYQERVLPIIHSFGKDSRLLIKKHHAMEAMILYLGEHTATVQSLHITNPSHSLIRRSVLQATKETQPSTG